MPVYIGSLSVKQADILNEGDIFIEGAAAHIAVAETRQSAIGRCEAVYKKCAARKGKGK